MRPWHELRDFALDALTFNLESQYRVKWIITKDCGCRNYEKFTNGKISIIELPKKELKGVSVIFLAAVTVESHKAGLHCGLKEYTKN